VNRLTSYARMAGMCLGTSMRFTHGLPDKRMIDAVLFNHVSSPRGTSWIPGVSHGFLYITDATPAEEWPQ
jgi:hypothetical protein